MRPRQPLLLLGGGAWGAGALAWWCVGGGLGWWWLALPAVSAAAAAWPGARATAVVIAVGSLLGGTAVTVHLGASRPVLLQAWAAEGEDAAVVGRVEATSVREAESIGSTASVRTVVLASSVVVAGEVLSTAAPMVLTGPVAVLGRPERGSVISASGRLLAVRPLREPGFALAVEQTGLVREPHGWSAAVATARGRMWRALDQIDPAAGSLVAGLAIGDDSRQSAELGVAMRASGLSHLTAVSGGNIAIIAGLVLGAASFLGASLRVRLAVAVAAVLAYAAFVGPEPSVLRAAVMGCVALLGLLRGGRSGGFPLLGLAMVALVVVRPGLCLSWGFALSVAATAGILWFGRALEHRLAHRLPRLHRPVLAAVAVTLGAQIATAPLLAAMTGTVALAAVPANLGAAPLVMPITVLGLLVTIVGLVSPAAAGLVAVVVEPFGMLLAAIAQWAAAQQWGTIAVPDGATGAAVVAAGALLAAAVWRGLGAMPAVAVVVSCLCAAAVVSRPSAVPEDWLAMACDVGQGDAFLVRGGPSSAMLIDTGPDPELLADCLARAGVEQVPVVLLTHFDTDHVAATEAALRGRGTAAVLVSPVAVPPENAAAVRSAARASGVEVLTARPGQRFAVGAATVRVLWPRRIIRDGSIGNNAAVATAVDVGGLRLLFTGDLEPLGQSGLRTSAPPGGFDVTTIPHHGSARQDPEFLPWTGASVAWVSAGEGNRFGHPRPAALDLARAAGMTVGRTDRHGTLALVARDGRPVILGLGSG